jgi:tetratricopeptide (TPR) repeat protein
MEIRFENRDSDVVLTGARARVILGACAQEAAMHARTLLATLSFSLLFLSPVVVQAHDADDTLGKVTFPTSCDARVQAEFERGVAMLHSYWFNTAGKTFQSVLEKDPNCAMAYWGIALDLLGNTLASPPPVKDAQAAWAALDKARTIGAKTRRERDWIEAISAYYRDYDRVPVNTRLVAYDKAMEQLVQSYPDDYEAKVYYALTLQASAPKSDVTYANQLKSAAILEKLYEQNPRHPGVTHFLIHAYDYPPLADRGIGAARRYAGIAPAVPHARHMPSHIYSMVGLWEESIASNMSALEIQPDYYHAYDFSVYAALQLGQDGRGKAMIEKAVSTPVRGDRPVGPGNFTALAAMPARYVLERADWSGAAALPVMPTRFPRGLGMARSGDAAGAKGEIEAMATLRSALQKSDQSFWADRTEEQMLAVSAWVALAEGNKSQAEKLMRAAANSEDGSVKSVLMENRLYPLRELLAELLLETGQAGPALQEFEVAIKAYSNRYRGLYGAARSAQAAGQRQKAADYFGKFVALTKNADSSRTEVASAKAYLAQR